MIVSGVINYYMVHSTTNGDTFLEFVGRCLLSCLMPFSGTNPNSVVIMDKPYRRRASLLSVPVSSRKISISILHTDIIIIDLAIPRPSAWLLASFFLSAKVHLLEEITHNHGTQTKSHVV